MNLGKFKLYFPYKCDKYTAAIVIQSNADFDFSFRMKLELSDFHNVTAVRVLNDAGHAAISRSLCELAIQARNW
jgi:hypothetical protein